MVKGRLPMDHSWTRCPLRYVRLYIWFVQDAAVSSLGSTCSALWLYRAQILEALAAILLLPIHLALFLGETAASARPGSEIWLLCLMPVLCSVVRLPLAYNNYKHCQYLAAATPEEEQLLQTLLVHFASKASRWSCIVAGFLLPWHFCNVLWCLVALPCSQYAEIFFWEMAQEAAPCEAFNFSSSFLCCMSMMTFCSRLVMPLALRIRVAELAQIRQQVTASAGGLSDEQLQQLPVRILAWADVSAASETLEPCREREANEGYCTDAASALPCCSICLEPFAVGDRLRQLSCRHEFHQVCVDTWLRRVPSCPLRCSTAQPASSLHASIIGQPQT
mmetsp:Transcript_40827/g.94707  ORF Transcript_40827/g.94707 Transcript_40827/m.94707 type:complete len:334 (-) Transcript_40827:396-1397(-)